MIRRRPALSLVVPDPALPEPRAAIDLQAAARLIGVRCDRTVRRLIDRGELEGYKPLAGKICVYLDSLEAFQKRRPQLGGWGLGGQQPGAPPPANGNTPTRPASHAAHRQAMAKLKLLGVVVQDG